MKNNNLIKAILSYLFVVVVFAIINYKSFLNNTTSFVISEQLNKHFQRYNYDLQYINIMKYHEDIKDEMPITIDGLKVIVNPAIDKLKCVQDSLEKKKKSLFLCESKLDSIYLILEDVRSDSIEKYRVIMLSDYQERIDSIENYLSGQDTTEMIIMGKYVELAEMNYQYAVKNYDVQSYIVSHYGSFIPDSISDLLNDMNQLNLKLWSDISRLEEELKEVTRTIRNYSFSFHSNRLEAVKFWDFLYYSVCISTTVSFGEIAPNSGWTRFLAMSELLLCLVIVGYIINTIIKKN